MSSKVPVLSSSHIVVKNVRGINGSDIFRVAMLQTVSLIMILSDSTTILSTLTLLILFITKLKWTMVATEYSTFLKSVLVASAISL